jgi:hypothetical protein
MSEADNRVCIGDMPMLVKPRQVDARMSDEACSSLDFEEAPAAEGFEVDLL